jgi:hypothetical protein
MKSLRNTLLLIPTLLLLGLQGCSVPGALVRNLKVHNSAVPAVGAPTYEIQTAGLLEQALQYVDRTSPAYVIAPPVSARVAGQTFIRAADSDSAAEEGSANFMSFTVGRSSVVYVAHDSRITIKPAWLTANFMDTGEQLAALHGAKRVEYELYRNVYPADSTVILGANTAAHEPTAGSMYTVIVVPSSTDVAPPAPPRNVHATCANAGVVGVEWTPATGDAQLAGYRVARDGIVVGTIAHARTSYSDTAVAATSEYRYSIIAFDGAGNTAASETLPVTTTASSMNGDAPYCRSSLIASMVFNFSSAYSATDGNASDTPPYSDSSDLWPLTWGEDGNTYTLFGDGWGLCGQLDTQPAPYNKEDKTSFGAAKISGAMPLGRGCPAQFAHGNIYGGYDSAHPRGNRATPLLNGKGGALIAVGSDLYAIGAIWRSEDGSRSSGAPEHQEIVYSGDSGSSWHDNTSWDFCSRSADGAYGGAFPVCPYGFVNYGKGNAGALDNYVYVYAVNASYYWTGFDDSGAAFPTFTYLLRAPNTELLTQSAYEYFAGWDDVGAPLWSSDPARRQPVFADRNVNQINPDNGYSFQMGMNIQEAVYNPVLLRYIATAQGQKIGQTAFFEAPNPWGPWSTLYYTNISAARDGKGGWGNLGAGSWNAAHDPLISDLLVNDTAPNDGSGSVYSVRAGAGLATGARLYIDQSEPVYVVTLPLPAAVSSQTFIQTADSDASAAAGTANFMSFMLGQPATVYIAHDMGIKTKPRWLTQNFADTQTYLTVAAGKVIRKLELYRRVYEGGAVVTLGSNVESGTEPHGLMYSVIVAPTGTYAGADSLGVHIGNAWTSADGKTLWLVFSSNGLAPSDALFAALAGNWMDSFNAVEVTLSMR